MTSAEGGVASLPSLKTGRGVTDAWVGCSWVERRRPTSARNPLAMDSTVVTFECRYYSAEAEGS